MPTWFYILTGCIAILGVTGIAVGVLIGTKNKAKARRLFEEMKRDNALVQSECMIRDGATQCPGAAVIADGTLTIKSVLDRTRQIPMSAVSVLKEGPGIGRYGWFGKRVFHLDTPETGNLAIGVNNPEPWRKAFANNNSGETAGPERA